MMKILCRRGIPAAHGDVWRGFRHLGFLPAVLLRGRVPIRRAEAAPTSRWQGPLAWALAGLLIAGPIAALASEEHAEEAHAEHEEGEALRMDPERREALGIVMARAASREFAETVTAPAEVRLDQYRSAIVTPRIPAQVVQRHVRMGDRVEAGQALVTLSSVEMAEAQADLVEADREWRRVRKLGRQVVWEKRYVAAQGARQRAWARVIAFGMTGAQVERLLAAGDVSHATGRFDLLSPRPGTVIRDVFVEGEVVEPGRVLLEVTDENILWVEAKLRPEQASGVRMGATAQVSRDGRTWIEGRIVQLHHRVDEATRTQAVRIQVANAGDRLHPGEYVEAVVPVGEGRARVAVPERAVVLLQGAPTVFLVEGEALHPQPVETGRTVAGWTEILAGVAEGDEVVVQGAFFLKSLLLKSEMGEGHAH